VISQEELKQLLLYDPSTGKWKWLVKRGSKCKEGWFSGTKGKNDYFYIEISNRSYLAHRLAWLWSYGTFPVLDLDHINNNPSDNRLNNLREVNKCVNLQNQVKPHKNNKSGYLGVSLNKKRGLWEATIMVEGKNKRLGGFQTPEEASLCYLKHKEIYHTKPC